MILHILSTVIRLCRTDGKKDPFGRQAQSIFRVSQTIFRISDDFQNYIHDFQNFMDDFLEFRRQASRSPQVFFYTCKISPLTLFTSVSDPDPFSICLISASRVANNSPKLWKSQSTNPPKLQSTIIFKKEITL